MRVAAYPHRKAVHCGSGTLASALAHRGLSLSEPMVFGLGAGLGFALHEGEPPQQASRFFVGRSPSFEQDLCASLGAELTVEQYDKPAGAWARCCELVAQGKPALVYTDLSEMPYIGARNHWYGHLVAVIGHEGDEAVISDNERPEPVPAPLAALPPRVRCGSVRWTCSSHDPGRGRARLGRRLRRHEGSGVGRGQVRRPLLRRVGSAGRAALHHRSGDVAAAGRAAPDGRGTQARPSVSVPPGARLLHPVDPGGRRCRTDGGLQARHPAAGRGRLAARGPPHARAAGRRNLAGGALPRDAALAMKLEYTISQDAGGQRLDKFLRRRLAEMPLSHLYKMVRTKKVRVNGARADVAQLLQPGDAVVVHGAREANPDLAPAPAAQRPASDVRQDFAVLYEDAHILVCNKPAGLPIHAGSGISGDTLVDQARAYLERQGLVVPEGEFKPSPAHRLDRETSGVVVVGKTRQAMVRLTEMFTAGEPKKTYLALAKGRFQRHRGTVDLRLAEPQQTQARQH